MFKMKPKTRKPQKSVKLSKWAFLLVYAFIILSVSSSYTLAKYITIGTIDDSVRVATTGVYTIYASQEDSENPFIEVNDRTEYNSVLVSADTANSGAKRFIRVRSSKSETLAEYSVVFVQYGKLPIGISITPDETDGNKRGTYATDPNEALANEYISIYADKSIDAEHGYSVAVSAYSGGIIPVNTVVVHSYELTLEWSQKISNNYKDYFDVADDYLLENEATNIDVYVITNQLDTENGN